MRTLFYIIKYKNEQVIYVGITTRSLIQRFKEHIKSKELNNIDYTIEKIDKIDHPDITTLQQLKVERERVYKLESYYIKEYSKNNVLLNISDGGEWGANLYTKLSKKEFIERFGTLEGYIKKVKNKKALKLWLDSWIKHYNSNKSRQWIINWISTKSMNKTKYWMRAWVANKSRNRTKCWLVDWCRHRSINKTKSWIQSWIEHNSGNKTKKWIQTWINNKSINKTQHWLRSWIVMRSFNPVQVWLRNWIVNRSN